MIETQTLAASLHQQVQDLEKKLAGLPSIFATFQRNTQALEATGITHHTTKEGDQAPAFALPNVRGTMTELASLLAQGPVVLVFYRGEWCPFCNLALHAYQNILPEIQQLEATLVAISPQTPDHSTSTTEHWQLQFEVLSDAGNKTARDYGLVFAFADELRAAYQQIGIDLEQYDGDNAWELPLAATFVIAQDGTVTYAFLDADYTRRAEPAAILDALHKLAR